MRSACAILYRHLGPAWLYNIFPQDLTNGMIFKKKLLDTKCVFSFSLRVTELDANKNVYRSSCKAPVTRLILMELENFLDRI